ncbi:MAG: serine/threonine protein kinase, partial [bacterium]
MNELIGKVVSHYRILEQIGQGGMGVVYKAEDTNLRRMVALKFLPPTALTGDAEKTRFMHEAQAAAALNHPNVCTVYEIDEYEGQPFIAMEFVAGRSLREMITGIVGAKHYIGTISKLSTRVAANASPLPIDDAIYYAIQIAEGLQAAHEQGIVHRDMKCDNVMVTEKGQVKIMDFGLAKLSGRTQVTREGTTLGTVNYMSPEQAQGAPVDHRTDIWSFGVMLYEMVTGQLPFKGDYEQAVLYSIMNEEAEPPTALRSGVPMELERIVTKCLHKDRSLRYQHADELIADLKALQKHQAETESTSGERRPPDSTSRISTEGQPVSTATTRRRRIGMIMALGLLALIAGISYVFLRETSQKPANGRQRIVVLPFENLGPPEDAYFADGITEEITSRLAAIRSLGVISRNSALHYTGSDKTIKQIGKELRVDYVLEGTVRWARSQAGG